MSRYRRLILYNFFKISIFSERGKILIKSGGLAQFGVELDSALEVLQHFRLINPKQCLVAGQIIQGPTLVWHHSGRFQSVADGFLQQRLVSRRASGLGQSLQDSALHEQGLGVRWIYLQGAINETHGFVKST